MPFAEHFMVQGTFTVPASIPAAVNINCGFIPTKVELINKSALLRLAGGPPIVNPTANYQLIKASWNVDFGTSLTMLEGMLPSSAGAAFSQVLVNGITPYDGHNPSPTQLTLGPKITGSSTAIATGTFTISSTATLYPGAMILMTGNTVNKQLAGMYFTVATVPNGTTFTIANSGPWLNTASFTTGAEVFAVQLVKYPALYYPQNGQVVFISAANPAVVTTSTNLNLTVGQQVRLYVPAVFGMSQANFVQGIVSAVSANQVTLGGLITVDASAFNAFVWPLAAGVPYSPAMLVPIGSGPTPTTFLPVTQYNQDLLDDATTNQAFNGFTVGAGILVADSTTLMGVDPADIFSWTAWRGDV